MSCNQCGDTGKEPTGKYCRCKEGRFKKRLDEAAKKAVQAKVDEKGIFLKATPDKKKTTKKRIIDYTPGDWVRIRNFNQELDGVLCEVVKTDGLGSDVKVLARGKNRYGKVMKGTTWLHISYLSPAPIELNDREKKDLRELYINMALDTNDIKWFNELGGKRND